MHAENIVIRNKQYNPIYKSTQLNLNHKPLSDESKTKHSSDYKPLSAEYKTKHNSDYKPLLAESKTK